MVAEVWGSPGRVRSTASWVSWGGEISRLADVARAIGADPLLLLDWLDDHAPSTGGKLAGRRLRWASPAEATAADSDPPPWSGPVEGHGSWVRWRSPDGQTRLLPLEEAAGLLRQGDQPCPVSALRAVLREGAWVHQGHSLELTAAPAGVVAIADWVVDRAEEPEAADDGLARLIAEEEAAEKPARRGSNRHPKGRPVWVGDRWFPSVTRARVAVGLSRQQLQTRLDAAGGQPIVIDGVIVRFADPGEGPAPAPAPEPEPATEQLEMEVTPDQQQTQGDRPKQRAKRAPARKRQTQPKLSPKALAARLLALQAEEQQCSLEDALLALIPPTPAMEAILSVVDRGALAALSPDDWARLQAIARVGS